MALYSLCTKVAHAKHGTGVADRYLQTLVATKGGSRCIELIFVVWADASEGWHTPNDLLFLEPHMMKVFLSDPEAFREH